MNSSISIISNIVPETLCDLVKFPSSRCGWEKQVRPYFLGLAEHFCVLAMISWSSASVESWPYGMEWQTHNSEKSFPLIITNNFCAKRFSSIRVSIRVRICALMKRVPFLVIWNAGAFIVYADRWIIKRDKIIGLPEKSILSSNVWWHQLI